MNAGPVLASTAMVVGPLAAALVIVGIVLTVVAIRLLRETRTDHAALGPLEVIGERSWRRADPGHRAAAIAGARPEGAEPVIPLIPVPLLVDQEPARVSLDPPSPDTVEPPEPESESESGSDSDTEIEWAADPAAADADESSIPPSLPPIPQPGPLEPHPVPPLPDPMPLPQPDPEPDPMPLPQPDPLPDPMPLPEPVPGPLPEPAPMPDPDPIPAPDPVPVPGPDPCPRFWHCRPPRSPRPPRWCR